MGENKQFYFTFHLRRIVQVDSIVHPLKQVVRFCPKSNCVSFFLFPSPFLNFFTHCLYENLLRFLHCTTYLVQDIKKSRTIIWL